MSDTTINLQGLDARVEIWRDAWGIPHARAQGANDAFFALGYVHATDRLWQMDAMRRRAIGRYAEWLGAAAVPADMLARRMGMAEASRRDAEAANAETRAMLEAYAAGVNARATTAELPPEYALLDEAFEPWEPWHSIAAFRQGSLLLNPAYPKLWRAIALPVVGEAAMTQLRMDDGGDELVCLPSGVTARRPDVNLETLRTAMTKLLATASPDATGGGSNNWALHGSRTASGRPLVAGDPHRLLEMPNLYYQCHVACDEFDVIGLTMPGVPGFPHFAHTAEVAWCVTVAFVDTTDIYLERFEDDGHRYLARTDAEGGAAQWADVERRVETIRVRGQGSTECEILRTMRGPVVAGDARSGSALVLRHTPDAETDRSFDCMRPMLRATSVEELYEACRGWGLIDHNLVAGDTAGHIGHLVRAKIPRRPAANGWLPVPGWLDAHAWDGFVPFERMPRQFDPDAGMIVTANNRIVAQQDEDYLTTDAHPPHRARRIWDRLQELNAATVDDMASVHRDLLSIPAVEICAHLARVPLTDEGAIRLRDRLVAWDQNIRADSVEANAYVSLRLTLAGIVKRVSGLGALDPAIQRTIPPGLSIEYELNWAMPRLLRSGDTSLIGTSSWDELLAEALATVARESLMLWGDRHHLLLKHPLSTVFPDVDWLATRDHGPVDGDNETVFTTGHVPRVGTHPAYASISRYVFDVGNWEACRWIVFHGSAGNPQGAHYDDQSAIWCRGELVPMHYNWSAIAQHAHLTETLAPGP
ncbi:penicillin acylase family protein [Tardiphaga sp.]|jgi:penicillin amidase|uniref:penicillin acylase family protein n=1 Tax=Tardiphaga sp. TaxID=1926292 RepID=UPI0037D9FBF2